MNAEAWRIMRALVQARRECEYEIARASRRNNQGLLYWGGRRKSIMQSIAIVRGLEHHDA